MRYVTVRLTARDVAHLRSRDPTAQGGLQSLIRRIKQGMRVVRGETVSYKGTVYPACDLTISARDVARIPRYWWQTGQRPGSGGYQRMLPIESLREHLATAAPLFGAEPILIRAGVSYVYFKQGSWTLFIKIGRGQKRRADQTRPTDSAEPQIVLLQLIETAERDESYYHNRFAHLRIWSDREWFRPGADLMAFIREQIDNVEAPA